MDETSPAAGAVAQPPPPELAPPDLALAETAGLGEAIAQLGETDLVAAMQDLAATARPPATLAQAVRPLLTALEAEQAGMPAPVEDAWRELSETMGDKVFSPAERGEIDALPHAPWLRGQTRALLAALAAAPLGWESDAVRAARQAVEAFLLAESAAPAISAAFTINTSDARQQVVLDAGLFVAAPPLIDPTPTPAPALTGAELEALQEQLQAAIADREGLYATWTATAAERDAALEQRDQAVAERDAAHLSRDAALTERNAAWAARDQAQAERDQASDEAAELRERLAASRGLGADLIEQRLQAHAEAERLRAQAATAEQELEAARAALAALEARAQRAEAEAQTNARSRDAALGEATQLQSRVRELLVEAARLRDQLEQLQSQTATHRETLAQAAELQRQLETAHREAQTRAEGAIAVSADLRAQVSALGQLLRDAAFELEQLGRVLSREAGWWKGRRIRARLEAAAALQARIGAGGAAGAGAH